MTPNDCRRRADELLRAAAQAANMRERGQLIDEAMRYHNLAQTAGDEGPSEGVEPELRP